MLSVQRTFEVAAPLDQVFAFLSDFTNTEQWDPGTVTTTRADNGPLEVGASFHNVSEFRGRRTELEYRLERFEPGERLTFVGKNKTVTATDDLSFRAADGHTSITYRAHFDFHGLARLAEPLLKSGFEKIADKTIAQMRATLEHL